ncbi:MAG: peroxiredoxin family protein [Gammaproteobacteria bacterium]|nr:peroxiredoxin family protein [Gammaproteobacteria bacterium]MDH3859469.1 peroxiredoxin family protein [Gammaproteobacteria bacterium]
MTKSSSILSILLLLVFATPALSSSPLFQNLKSGAFETIENHSQQGKWLIVMIWAHDCEICEREVDDYQRFHQKHADKNATVLGVTLDGAERQQAAVDFVTRHQLNFVNLIAEPEVVTAYYQITTGSQWIGTPSFLIFGPDGELKAKQAGAVETGVVEAFIAASTSN